MSSDSQLLIRQWQPCLEDAQMLYDVTSAAKPLESPLSPELTLKRLPKIIEGIEEGALLALEGGRAVGAVLLSMFPDPEVAYMRGGVHPDAQGRGVGRALLERAASIAQAKGCKRMRAPWSLSDQRSARFMTAGGFEPVDHMFWSSFNTAQTISGWALAKESAALNAGVRVLSGSEFESVRPDWDRVWWRHLMDCMQDVPMEIPFKEIPFETWRPLIDPPFMDRARVLVALDQDVMVGLMYLGHLKRGRVNIDHTSVSRAYRRRGISTMIKCEAIRRVRASGAQELTTQNHEDNPMFNLNRALGFQHIATFADGFKSLI